MSVKPVLAGLRWAALVALLLISCYPMPRRAEREYGFVHLETTGITAGVLIPGAARSSTRPEGYPDVLVRFSKESDRDAVDSLGSLDGNVLLPNAKAGIVVVGILDPEARHSPNGPGMPASEPYQEFRLSRWYLRAPFKRLLGSGAPFDDSPPGIEHDSRLQPEDFGGKVDGDLSRFVRQPVGSASSQD